MFQQTRIVSLIWLMVIGCNQAMSAIPAAIRSPNSQPPAVVCLWETPTTAPDTSEVVDDRGTASHHDRLIKNITHPRLWVFLPDHPDPRRPACIICPGGGYTYLTVDKEGDDVARMLNQHGVAAFVLISRLPDGSDPQPGTVPAPIQDVHRAIRLVRAEAPRWNIDPARIGIMGFSAGGHVASTAATQFDPGDPSAIDPISRQSSRPDFAVLMYPVVSMHDPIAHVGSRHNLLGIHATEEWMDRYSADQHITRQTPPLFIVHAEDDHTVPVANSLRVADAKAGVPCELVLLQKGGHGFGLGVHGGEAATWPRLCIQWMSATGILQ